MLIPEHSPSPARRSHVRVAPEPAPNRPLPRRTPRFPRTWPGWIVFAFTLVVVVQLARRGVEWGMSEWTLRVERLEPHGLVIIDSQPPDALLFIEGTAVGRTPYVTANTYAKGKSVRIRVVHPDYPSWEGTFPGGVQAMVTAELWRGDLHDTEAP
jgi:hypothetical protein